MEGIFTKVMLRWLCLVLTIGAVISLTGCGSHVLPFDLPADDTIAETTVADFSGKPQYVDSYAVGSVARYDLNGDGIDEDITVTTHEYEAGKLTIGDSSVEIWSCTPTGYFTIVNVDASDDRLLVGISDYGPSDDPETVLYAYDGMNIREIGYFSDIVGQNIYDYDGAECHGDGTITAGKRWDVLGTWNTVGTYRVTENGIEDITDFYPYLDWDGNFTGWEVTSKVDLPMYDPGRPDAAAVIVPAGTSMAMTGLQRGEGDNLYWVTFEVESMGKTLGMTVEQVDWYTCVYTGGEFVTSEEAFDGFFYAG